MPMPPPPPTPPPPPLPPFRPLDYATTNRPQRDRSLDWRSHVMVAVAITVCGVVLTASLIFVPHFVTVFRDFKTPMPAPTLMVIATCKAMGSPWGWLVLMVDVALIAGGMAIDLACVEARPVRLYARLVVFLLLLAGAAWLVLCIIAMFAPLFALTNSLTGGGK